MLESALNADVCVLCFGNEPPRATALLVPSPRPPRQHQEFTPLLVWTPVPRGNVGFRLFKMGVLESLVWGGSLARGREGGSGCSRGLPPEAGMSVPSQLASLFHPPSTASPSVGSRVNLALTHVPPDAEEPPPLRLRCRYDPVRTETLVFLSCQRCR